MSTQKRRPVIVAVASTLLTVLAVTGAPLVAGGSPSTAGPITCCAG